MTSDSAGCAIRSTSCGAARCRSGRRVHAVRRAANATPAFARLAASTKALGIAGDGGPCHRAPFPRSSIIKSFGRRSWFGGAANAGARSTRSISMSMKARRWRSSVNPAPARHSCASCWVSSSRLGRGRLLWRADGHSAPDWATFKAVCHLPTGVIARPCERRHDPVNILYVVTATRHAEITERWRPASTPRSFTTAIRINCPVASSSASRSPGPWRCVPG